MSQVELDQLIKNATSESIPNGELDLAIALEISDMIRSKKISTKQSMRSLKNRIIATQSNPNTQLASWKLVSICVKNCGLQFVIEICSKEFMDLMERTILKNNSDDYYVDQNEIFKVTLELFYELYITFRDDSRFNYLRKIYDKLVSKHVEISDDLKSNVNANITMFDSKVPAEWIESDACMICSNQFSFFNRRHHCRSCGGIFCQDHSSKFIELPDLGIYENVRVCDNCYDDYNDKKNDDNSNKKKSKRRKSKHKSEDDAEDEQLRKAIELSLRESQEFNSKPIVPVEYKKHDELPNSRVSNGVTEDDPDLKAAIEASLREAEQEKLRREQQQQQHESIEQEDSFNLSIENEDTIYEFAAMMERLKTQSPMEVLQNPQIQKMYENMLNVKPKLNNVINDRVQKYNALIEINGKLSDITNTYDHLLEEQLKVINLSQQYTLPVESAVAPPAFQNQVPQMYNQPAYNAAYIQQTYSQPAFNTVPQINPLSTVPVENIVRQNNNPSQLDANINKDETVKADLPYPIETETTSGLVEPSEPVYPDDIDINNEQTNEKKANATTINESQTTKNENITDFNFPNIPSQKLPTADIQDTKPINEEEVEEEPKEEELLLEL